ncbi:MAG TPA: thiamine phosphate synthase [bacterium]|nr:thiamine phosphate synthase [bacterium]
MPAFDRRLQCYAITDQASAKGRDDAAVAEALLRGSSSCLQYRAKKVAAREQWRMAGILRRLTRDAGALFIVNDRVDLALDSGADGVHLGQDDLPVAVARSLARRAGRPDLIIGLSTHSLEQARAAEGEGADYIGFGPVFATLTKENNVPPVGTAALAAVLEAVALPVVAIGGIKMGHLGALAGLGARHCAIVTALTSAEDVAAAAGEHWRVWREARDGRAPGA